MAGNKRIARMSIACLIATIMVCPANATSIIIDFTKDRIIFVADSLVTYIDPEKQTAKIDVCKLTALGGEFIFAESGYTGYTHRLLSDPIPEWEGTSEALRAYDLVSNHDLYSVAQNWMVNVSGYFKQLYSADPSKITLAASQQGGLLVKGFFGGKSGDGSLAVYIVTIGVAGSMSPTLTLMPPSLLLATPITNEISKIEPRKPFSSDNITQELLDGQTERAKKSAEKWQKEVRKIPKSKRNVRWLEFLIQETGTFNSSVGGAANVLSVSANKSVVWICNQTCK
jgi:hypothetical protein